MKCWWQRDDLRYVDNCLFLGNQNLYSLAYSAETPCYVYNSSRIKQNVLRLHSALSSAFLQHQIFYSVKANRHPAILSYLRSLGLVGIDCCSPNELILSRQYGFLEEEISYTGTSVSDNDLLILAKHSKTLINCDSLSQIRRLGSLSPGREIGIRINPSLGFSYRNVSKFQYSGYKTTKFGIYKDSFCEALKLAEQYQLKVVGIHCHVAYGFSNEQLPIFELLLKEIDWFAQHLDNIKYINLGGGLGVPMVKNDSSLNLEVWSQLIAKYFASKDLVIMIEPGGYIVKDAGILLLQVTTVEKKRDQIFVYVNGGFNINLLPAFYQLPLEIVPVVLSEKKQGNTDSSGVKLSIVGNINEAIDVFAEDICLPLPQEGDYLAFLNAGGYGSSMSSNHCMRGEFREYFLYNN